MNAPDPAARARGDRSRTLVNFIAGARERRFPPEVIDEAKRTLLDICGVSIGAVNDDAVVAVESSRAILERFGYRSDHSGCSDYRRAGCAGEPHDGARHGL